MKNDQCSMLFKKTWFYILLIFLAMLCYLDFKNLLLGRLFGIQIGVINDSANLILSWTILTIAWYSYETLRIRKINSEQRDLQLLPAIMLYIRRKGTKRGRENDQLTIRNIGFGSAVDITILPASLNVAEKRLDFEFILGDCNNTLVPQEEREVGVYMPKARRVVKPLETFMAYFDPDIQRRAGTNYNRDIKILFRDAVGQKYNTIISFGGNEISVKAPPCRIDN